MRAVTTETAALALGLAKKDLDNILSRYPVPGFERGTRGVSRRLSLASIEVVAVAIDLARDFSIPIPAALQLATLLHQTREGVISSPDRHLALHADLDRIRRDVQARLVEAVEHVIPARRGRPRGS